MPGAPPTAPVLGGSCRVVSASYRGLPGGTGQQQAQDRPDAVCGALLERGLCSWSLMVQESKNPAQERTLSHIRGDTLGVPGDLTEASEGQGSPGGKGTGESRLPMPPGSWAFTQCAPVRFLWEKVPQQTNQQAEPSLRRRRRSEFLPHPTSRTPWAPDPGEQRSACGGGSLPVKMHRL